MLLPTLALLLNLGAIIVWPSWWLGILLGLVFLLWILVLWFFRDPERSLERNPQVFYSPADGVVSDLEIVQESEHYHQSFLRIGIFLSVFDVHVQRVPIQGVVDFVAHRPGLYHPAFDQAASSENDQIAMGLDTVHGKILVKQIAGILARRCMNYARVGEEVATGQRYGLIKFGSRAELYLPENVRLKCSIGDKVKGGLTELAEIGEL